MPVSKLPDLSAPLDDFRITSAIEIRSLLRQLLDSHALITLSGPGGASYTTLLWSVDEERGAVCFSAEGTDNCLQALLETNEVVAVGYLDSIKVQFDVDGLVQVRGGKHSALNGCYPRELFRFQRREAFRVKPLLSNTPQAHVRHPAMPDMLLALRVLDVSLKGAALFLPEDVPMIPAGVRIGQCQLDLDEDTRLDVGLVIHHVTVIHPGTRGARLGCEIIELGSQVRTLQRYIDQTQKRRLALASDPSAGKR